MITEPTPSMRPEDVRRNPHGGLDDIGFGEPTVLSSMDKVDSAVQDPTERIPGQREPDYDQLPDDQEAYHPASDRLGAIIDDIKAFRYVPKSAEAALKQLKEFRQKIDEHDPDVLPIDPAHAKALDEILAKGINYWRADAPGRLSRLKRMAKGKSPTKAQAAAWKAASVEEREEAQQSAVDLIEVDADIRKRDKRQAALARLAVRAGEPDNRDWDVEPGAQERYRRVQPYEAPKYTSPTWTEGMIDDHHAGMINMGHPLNEGEERPAPVRNHMLEAHLARVEKEKAAQAARERTVGRKVMQLLGKPLNSFRGPEGEDKRKMLWQSLAAIAGVSLEPDVRDDSTEPATQAEEAVARTTWADRARNVAAVAKNTKVGKRVTGETKREQIAAREAEVREKRRRDSADRMKALGARPSRSQHGGRMTPAMRRQVAARRRA